MADYYEILGVPRQATSAEIRQAYLRLARERHPDRFSDPEEKARAQEAFKDATAAFNTLSNERSRQSYDQELLKPKLSTPEEIGRDALARGLARFEARDYHEAMELLRTAAQLLPGEPQAHAGLGRTLAKNPHWVRDAIKSLETAVRLAPRKAVYHAWLAELLLGQGLKLRAGKVLERAAELAAEDPEVARVARLFDAGRPEEP